MYVGVYTWVCSVNRVLEEPDSLVLHIFCFEQNKDIYSPYSDT